MKEEAKQAYEETYGDFRFSLCLMAPLNNTIRVRHGLLPIWRQHIEARRGLTILSPNLRVKYRNQMSEGLCKARAL